MPTIRERARGTAVKLTVDTRPSPTAWCESCPITASGADALRVMQDHLRVSRTCVAVFGVQVLRVTRAPAPR